MRESIPRQADKSRVPEKEKGVWNSQRGRKEKHLFFLSLHSFILVTENVFFFKARTDDYMTNNCLNSVLRLRNVEEKKMFVLSSSLRIRDPYLHFESPKSFLLLGTPDFLSTCLGIDSLKVMRWSPHDGISASMR